MKSATVKSERIEVYKLKSDYFRIEIVYCELFDMEEEELKSDYFRIEIDLVEFGFNPVLTS